MPRSRKYRRQVYPQIPIPTDIDPRLVRERLGYRRKTIRGNARGKHQDRQRPGAAALEALQPGQVAPNRSM
jgi:hypothetical protein